MSTRTKYWLWQARLLKRKLGQTSLESFLGVSSNSAVIGTLSAVLSLVFFFGFAARINGNGTRPPVREPRREALLPDNKTQNGFEFHSIVGQQSNDENSDDRVESRVINPLKHISFMVGKRYLTLADAEEEARELLRKEKLSPPANLTPSFEVEDKPVFLTVKFLQGIGKRYWVVSFNREFQVDSIESHILKE